MQIDPTSPEGLAFLADHLADGFPLEDVIHDELTTCEICGRHFTDFAEDFDHEADGGRMCWACSGDPEAAPYDYARQEATYSAGAL